MRRTALAALLLGLLAPAASPAAAHACGSSPYRTVQRFYSSIDAGAYRTAWRCLAPATQARFGGYDAWRRGYRGTLTSRLTSIRVAEGTSTVARIRFGLRTCRAVGSQRRVERFAGTWEVRGGGSTWRMWSPAVRRTSSRTLSSC